MNLIVSDCPIHFLVDADIVSLLVRKLFEFRTHCFELWDVLFVWFEK